MILPDVNVLVYAFRRDAPQHAVSRAWLNSVIENSARFGISPLSLSAVVRIATNARIYRVPSEPKDAFGFCNDILAQPHCVPVAPGEHHWEIFQRVCLETGTRGRRITHAWYAALAIEWGCEWVTFDRHFMQFPGLKCQLLTAPSS